MFAKRKTSEEQFKEFSQCIRKNKRMVEREKNKISKQGIDLKSKLKQFIKESDMDNAMMISQSLIRNKKTLQNFSSMITKLDELYNNIVLMKAKYGVTQALKISGKMMAQLNKSISLEEINNIIKQFSFENEQSEVRDEMIDDIMGTAVEDEEIDDEITKQIHSIFNDANIEMPEEFHNKLIMLSS